MFAGHVAAGLALSRADRRLNAGTVVGAALLLDIALWVFVLLGWEAVTIPPDFAVRHQAAFVFPYSHGLVAAAAWSVGAGAAVALVQTTLRDRRLRAAGVVAAAVFSHWVLDALVHTPELPLAGPGSAKVGLGLWDWPLAGLGLEAVLVLAGAAILWGEATLPRGRRIGLVVLCLLLLAFTIAGMTVAPPPPSAAAMAGSSLVTLAIVCAVIALLDRARSTAGRA